MSRRGGVDGGEPGHRRLHPILLVGRLHAHVDLDPSFRGHDVVGRTCVRNGRGDGRPDLGSSDPVDHEDLVCRLDECVHAVLRLQTRVGGPAADHDLERAAALPSGLQATTVRRRLEHQHVAARSSAVLDQLARVDRANLLVGAEQQLDTGAIGQTAQSVQRLDDAAEHVEHPGPGGDAVVDGERSSARACPSGRRCRDDRGATPSGRHHPSSARGDRRGSKPARTTRRGTPRSSRRATRRTRGASPGRATATRSRPALRGRRASHRGRTRRARSARAPAQATSPRPLRAMLTPCGKVS